MTSLLFPKLGFGRISERPEEVLLLCFYDPIGISTVPETVAYLQMESRYSVSVLNLFEHRQSSNGLELAPGFNLNRFAAIIIHNTVSYNVDNLRSLDRLLTTRLEDFKGAKLLLKQDENFRFREVAEYIGEIGFDVVFTCLPDDAIAKIYPAEIVGNTRFVRMLTGYVTPSLRTIPPQTEGRPIDIGYRGSIQPLSFGRLAYEKRKIGDDVKSRLDGTEIKLDISSRWEDRIGGAGWFRFLSTCKATLGAESGASLFDLNGDLESRCHLAEQVLGPFRPDHDYAESYLGYIGDLEGNIYYNQISPRHFEAIATQTLQLLYPGDYSGILQPGMHYFPLERDYSNLHEGIDLLMDDSKRKEITTRARDEVLMNREYWIETFVDIVDREIQIALEKNSATIAPSFQSNTPATNVMLIAAHEPRIDPRLDWISSNAPSPLKIHQCGVLHPDKKSLIREIMPNGTLYQALPRMSYVPGDWAGWLALVKHSPPGVAAVQEMMFLEQALSLPKDKFAELFAAPAGCERITQFRWYLQYFLDTSATLLCSCFEIRGVHAVIATDLDTLIPALVLKSVFGVPVFYDAHEYWAHSDVNSFEFEKCYWVALESRLVAFADYRQIVSPGLAALLSEQYSSPFSCLPNCEPWIPNREVSLKDSETVNGIEECNFLFQGGFAQGRGLDLLINAWSQTCNHAILSLRGRDNLYKSELIALAETTGLMGSRILFPEPVDETEMINAASKADVGIAPYPPTNVLYANCSPNKISQYMAAGIPILANDTNFVREVVATSGCGVIVDFSRVKDLVLAVNRLTEDWRLREQLAAAGTKYYSETFNWQKASAPFYSKILIVTETVKQSCIIFYPVATEPYSVQVKDRITEFGATLVLATIGPSLDSSRAQFLMKLLMPLWIRIPIVWREKIGTAATYRISQLRPK